MRVLASKLAQAFCLLVPTLALLVPADWAAAEPSEEQVAAIKSNCRSDFMSKCWGVPRGGTEAMQCLKKSMASLSAPCQQALKAVNAAPAKAPSAAPAAAAKPESAPATPAQPSPAAAAKTAAPAAPETPPSMQDSKPDAASAPASQPAPASPPMAAAKAPAKPSAPTHATTPQSPASSATQAKTEESAGVEKSGTGSSVKQPSAAPATSEETQPIIGPTAQEIDDLAQLPPGPRHPLSRRKLWRGPPAPLPREQPGIPVARLPGSPGEARALKADPSHIAKVPTRP